MEEKNNWNKPNDMVFIEAVHMLNELDKMHVQLNTGAMGVLLYSAFLTAIYMGQMILKGWFPRKECRNTFTGRDCDPGWKMKLPLLVFAIVILCLGLFAKPLMGVIEAVAYGTF